MASSLGCLVSLPQTFVKHRVIPQINICKMLSRTPRELLSLVELGELTEQALLSVLKKGTNSDRSDYQIKICQPGLVQSLNGPLNRQLLL